MEATRGLTARASRALVVAAGPVLAGVLAGCAGPTSVADRAYPGLPDSLSEAEQAELIAGTPDDEYVRVVWLDEGARFAVITFGSSSCPWVLTGHEPISDESVRVELEVSGGDACTDDLAPFTHELVVPESVTQRPVTVQLTHTDGDSFTEVPVE